MIHKENLQKIKCEPPTKLGMPYLPYHLSWLGNPLPDRLVGTPFSYQIIPCFGIDGFPKDLFS